MGYVARYGYITGKLYEYSFSLYLLCDNDFFFNQNDSIIINFINY